MISACFTLFNADDDPELGSGLEGEDLSGDFPLKDLKKSPILPEAGNAWMNESKVHKRRMNFIIF
jgi:hypothetical protein